MLVEFGYCNAGEVDVLRACTPNIAIWESDGGYHSFRALRRSDHMKISMFVSQLYAPEPGVIAGGNINSMVHLASALAEQGGHEVTLFAGWPHPYPPEEAARHLPFARLHTARIRGRSPVARNLQLLARLTPRMVRFCSPERCDILHSHTGFTQLSLFALLVRAVRRICAVHTAYLPVTNSVHDGHSAVLSALSMPVATMRRFDRVIAVSENVRRSLLNAGVPAAHVELVPPALTYRELPPPDEVQALRESLGLRPDERVLLFVGNYSRTKGVDLLLEALPRLKKKAPDLRLVCAMERPPSTAGQEAIRRALEEAAARGDVLHLGIVRDIRLLMAAVDAFVLPARNTRVVMDPPMAILEAMAMGTPVVSTTVGAIPEFVLDGETGFLVPPDDGDRLVAALQWALEDRERLHELGQTARQEVYKRCHSQVVMRQVIDIYEDVLARRSKGAHRTSVGAGEQYE